MSNIALPRHIQRAMVIMAHPDDPEFFCGATVAYMAQQGIEVTYLILTDGSKGSDDRTLSTRDLIRIRREEQRAAANVLGVKHVVFFDEPDGELQNTLDVRRNVVREIRRYRPDVVIAPDPQRYYFDSGYINHTDHRAAGVIALDAVFPASQNFRFFPVLLEEGFEPHHVREVWLAGACEPNFELPLDHMFDKRVEAILQHRSQFSDPEGLVKRLQTWREESGGHVERYRRLRLVWDEEEEETQNERAPAT
ncbi:MAG: PIG-L family deacetylase [Ardenticatenia bacterium]|nr:MAG: PIG-L family deacetylase [Ardenticatenia bacterium]